MKNSVVSLNTGGASYEHSTQGGWRSEARALRDEFLDNFIGLIVAVAVVIVLLLEWAK